MGGGGLSVRAASYLAEGTQGAERDVSGGGTAFNMARAPFLEALSTSTGKEPQCRDATRSCEVQPNNFCERLACKLRRD